MGRVGSVVADFSFFVFGRYVSFLLAILFFLWGFGQFRGQTSIVKGKVLVRLIGAFILVVCLCTLLALFYDPNTQRQQHFDAGGLIGSYITYYLGIAQVFGPVGAYIFAVTGVLIGIVLATEFLFSTYLIALKIRWMERWRSFRHPGTCKWQHELPDRRSKKKTAPEGGVGA